MRADRAIPVVHRLRAQGRDRARVGGRITGEVATLFEASDESRRVAVLRGLYGLRKAAREQLDVIGRAFFRGAISAKAIGDGVLGRAVTRFGALRERQS